MIRRVPFSSALASDIKVFYARHSTLGLQRGFKGLVLIPEVLHVALPQALRVEAAAGRAAREVDYERRLVHPGAVHILPPARPPSNTRCYPYL